MRILYKALASIGMLALSCGAALGVKHLADASKKRKNNMENDSDASESKEEKCKSPDDSASLDIPENAADLVDADGNVSADSSNESGSCGNPAATPDTVESEKSDVQSE